MSIHLEQVSEEEVRVEVGDKAYLIAAYCPHRKARLVYSHVSEKRLRVSCPMHYSTFDLETGQVVSGPSCKPLQVKPLPEPR
jgi:nitrite reductase (NADH) small subunit